MDFPVTEDCAFCRIIAEGREIIAANDLAVAFFDSYPCNPGHALIVPRAHVADFFALPQFEQTALFALLPRVRRLVEKDHPADGFNIGINVGSQAGQTIGHVHLHLIPRLKGDADPRGDGSHDPRGGIRWVVPARAAYWDD